MGRTTSHLKLVDGRTRGRESVGPYALRGSLLDHGHPDLRLAWRHEPEALRGRYAVLVLEQTAGRLPNAASAILRNAARAMGVRHPATVPVRDVVGDQNVLGIVTDHVPGISIESVLTRLRGRPLPRGIALVVAATLLEALDDIHSMPREKGRHALPAAHGDVRARNVLLADNGAVRLLGFGLPLPREAFDLKQPESTSLSSTTGELWFPTPEGDQFAAGLLLLSTLVANREGLSQSRGPGPDADRLRAGLSEFELDDPLLPVLLTLLARRSEHRFPSCADAATALRRLQEDDESLLLARFASRLHQDEVSETEVAQQLPDLPVQREEQVSTDPLDVSVTAKSEEVTTSEHEPVTSEHEPVPSEPPRTAPTPTQPAPDQTNLDPDSTNRWQGTPARAEDFESLDLDELADLQRGQDESVEGLILDKPTNEWSVGMEEDEIRTVPVAADFDPRPRPNPKAVSQPGRTVPYSPAFVPRAAKWRKDEPPRKPDIDLDSPWALGLMSGTMDAVDLGGRKQGSVDEPAPVRAEPPTHPSPPSADTVPLPPAPPAGRPPAPPSAFAETTAIPAAGRPAPVKPTAPDAGPPRRRRSRRRKRDSRLSQALQSMGLAKAVQNSWVLTFFIVAVVLLTMYAGWHIWLRSQATEPVEDAPQGRFHDPIDESR